MSDDAAVLAVGVYRAAVAGVDGHVHAVARQHLIPVFVCDALAIANHARPAPCGVVLHAAVDVVGLLHVDCDVIELTHRIVVQVFPALRAVAAHPDTAVVAVDQVTGISWVDPQRMVIRVNLRVALEERPARVVGDGQFAAENIDPLFVIRIDADLAVIHRPRIQAVHPCPCFALVFGPKYAAFLVLDGRIHDVGVAAGDVEADSPHGTFGKAVAQLPPGASAIDALVDPAVGTAAVEAPRTASTLIGRGIEHLGIGRVHRQINRAGVFIQAKHVLPVLSAVDRHEHAAFRVRTPKVSERGRVYDIGVLRIDDDSADVVRLTKTHVLPRPAAVGRLVDAIAPRGALSIVGFARADPDHVGIGRVDGHVADGHR